MYIRRPDRDPAQVKIPENYSASDNDRFQIWGKFSLTTKKGIAYLGKDISITIED